MDDTPFWKRKTLGEMSRREWESLCDGCAKCCLVKMEDEDTGDTVFTNLHCRLLDAKTCQCSDYANRKQHVPECLKLTPAKVGKYNWLPKTCAYRLLEEGRDLPDWHYLVCGDREEVHRRGVSGRGRTIDETRVSDEDWIEHIVDWADRPVSHFAKRRRRRV